MIARKLVAIKLAQGLLDDEIVDSKSADLNSVNVSAFKSKDRGTLYGDLKISFNVEPVAT